MRCRITGKEFENTSQVEQCYKRFDLPPPDTHPLARLMEKAAYGNTWNLFRAREARTGKEILSNYNPARHPLIYDHTYWMSPDFDPRAYGRNFDFNRPFFEQFAELADAVPKPNITMIRCEDMEYCNYAVNSRRSYLCFNVLDSERLMYCSRAIKSKDSIGLHNSNGCELCYECIGCRDCYNVAWSSFSSRCTDSRFLYNCEDCANCYQCAHLKHKQYCIQNQQYTKEEYERIISGLNLASEKIRRQEDQKWHKFLLGQPLKAEMNAGCERSDGVMLNNCTECHFCYSLSQAENCFNSYGAQLKDSCDSSGYHGSEYVTNSLGIVNSRNVFCSWGAEHGFDIGYSQLIFQSQECFGCFGLRGAKWCILNQQYAKDDYEKLKAKVIAQMKQTGEWGRFFPARFSPFSFSESGLLALFSLSEAEKQALGVRQDDPEPKANLEQEGARPSAEIPDLPDDFQDFDTVWKCEQTGLLYKITPQEAAFHVRMRVPLPQLAWKRRLEQGYRAAFRLPYPAQCSACKKSILSAFSQEEAQGRSRICDSCWNAQYR